MAQAESAAEIPTNRDGWFLPMVPMAWQRHFLPQKLAGIARNDRNRDSAQRRRASVAGGHLPLVKKAQRPAAAGAAGRCWALAGNDSPYPRSVRDRDTLHIYAVSD